MSFIHVGIILCQAKSYTDPKVGEWWCCSVEPDSTSPEEEYLVHIDTVHEDGEFTITDLVEGEEEKLCRSRLVEWVNPENVETEGLDSKPYFCFAFCLSFRFECPSFE